MSNDTDDSKVEFEIDVIQNPGTRGRIEGLTKLVMDSQAKMSAGVERMGIMAQAAAAGMSPLVAKMEAFKKSSMAGVDGLRSEFNKLDSAAGKRIDRTIKVDVVGWEKVKELEASIDRMAVKAGRGPSVPSSVPGMPGPSGAVRSRNGGIQGMDVPDNLRGMFKKLEAEAGESANRIGKAMDDKIGKIPKLHESTESLKKAFKERSDASKKLRDDYEKAVDNMGEASERMNANLVKGGRSLIGMTKGFAELGLMSTETTEQLARGMVAVQGAFDIFDGAADLLESISGGRKAKRMARKAASEVAEAGAAMAGGSMVRAVGGRVAAAGVTSAVVGAGVSASGAGVAAGAGATGVGAAGAGLTGLLAPAAAAGAALAAVGLVAVELKEVFSGTANKVGSVTDTIASWEVGLATSINRWRGDKAIMASNPNSGLNGLAQSQIRVERGERSLKTNKIKQTQKDETENVRLDVKHKTEMQGFQDRSRQVRGKSENTFRTDATVTKESQFREMSMRRLAESQSVVDKGASGEVSRAVADRAAAEVKMQQDMLLKSQVRQNSAASGQVGTNLKSEQGLGNEADLERLKVRRELARIESEGGASAEKIAKLREREVDWSSAQVSSLERQKSLVKERLSVELQGQGQVRDLLKSQLDLTTQKLDRSKSEKASAVGNFARLGEIEKQQALKALEQGRAKGAASLDDTQKDLLRSVGTKEANSLATQGDEAEAKKYGFSEKNFGQGFGQEQATLTKAKQEIEAKLSTSYDVSVKLTNDTGALVDSVTQKVESLLRQNHDQVTRELNERFQASLTEINNRTADQLKNLGKQRI